MFPNPKQLREALDDMDVGMKGPGPVVWSAASWAVDLFVECENCEGTGWKGEITDYPCPSCEGRGFSLNRERLERAARALRRRRFGEPTDLASGLVDSQPDPVIEADAESAILAFLFGDST